MNKNSINSTDLQIALGVRFPRAIPHNLFDTDYQKITTVAEIEKLYNGFQRWMKLMRLVKWRWNVMDCDKRAWLLKAYVIAVTARRAPIQPLPVFLITYRINGEAFRGHSVVTVYSNGYFIDIDPKPKKEGGGIFKLSKKEEESVDLYVG